MKLKDQVEYCLKHYEKSRNSDIHLTIAVWLKFYKDKVIIKDGKAFIDVESLFILPREDSVKRLRAMIQNDGNKYLPTSYEVRKQRKIKEEDWRSQLGYNPELRTI